MIKGNKTELAKLKGLRLGSKGGSISKIINTGVDLPAVDCVDLFARPSDMFGGFR
jgi:superfamily II DNA or RNA helicase